MVDPGVIVPSHLEQGIFSGLAFVFRVENTMASSHSKALSAVSTFKNK